MKVGSTILWIILFQLGVSACKIESSGFEDSSSTSAYWNGGDDSIGQLASSNDPESILNYDISKDDDVYPGLYRIFTSFNTSALSEKQRLFCLKYLAGNGRRDIGRNTRELNRNLAELEEGEKNGIAEFMISKLETLEKWRDSKYENLPGYDTTPFSRGRADVASTALSM